MLETSADIVKRKRLVDCSSWAELLATYEALPRSEIGHAIYELILDGKHAWANNLARITLRKNPRGLWALKSAIISCTHLDATQQNLTLCEQLLQHEPEEIFARCHEAAALQKQGRYQEALNKAHQITKDAPHAAQAWLTSAVCADRLEIKKEALFLWQKTLEVDPGDQFAPGRILDLLTEKGDFSHASEILRSAYEKGQQSGLEAPALERLKKLLTLAEHRRAIGDPGILFEKAKLYTKRSQFENALELYEKFQNAYPGVFVVERYNILRCLGRYDEIREALKQQAEDSPNSSEGVAIQEAYTCAHEERFEDAIRVLKEYIANNKPAPWASQYLAVRYRQAGDLAASKSTILNCLNSPLIGEDARIGLTMSLANHEVFDHKPEKAIGLMKQLWEYMGDKAFKERFPRQIVWWLVQQGRLAEAREVFNEQQKVDPSRTLLPSVPLQILKGTALATLGRQRVVLIAVAHNEMERIESFLEHYRGMGVRLFLIVDDDSTDGTREFLLSQEDCCVFSTPESYSYSGFGITWVHQLIDTYCLGKWCIHVDVDELLVIPHFESDTIEVMLDYMERYGFKALPAFMLDMFPRTVADLRKSGDPLEVCPYFDADLHFMGSLEAPYQQVIGGFRQRITGSSIGGGIALHKTPLILGAPDIRFLTSTHHISPTSVADVRASLLHFKFYGDLENYLASCLERKEHHASAMVYRWYNRWFERTNKEEDLLGPSSYKFTSSTQLVELGLLKTSLRYEELRRKASSREKRRP